MRWWWRLIKWLSGWSLGRCDNCKRWALRRETDPMTYYGDEPRYYRYCRACSDTYTEYWGDMWDQYNSSRL